MQDQDWKSTKCSKKCQAQACRFRTGKVPNARRNVRPKLVGLQLENYQILEELSGQSFGFSHHQIFELLQPLSKQKCVSFWSADGFYSFHFNAWLHFLSKLLPPSADRSQFNGKDFEFSSPSQVCQASGSLGLALICPVQRRFGKFHLFQFFNTPYIGKTVRLTTLDKSPSQNGY